MRRWFLKFAVQLLKVDDTPERTALAFSIGVFLAFSPFFGLHTLLGLLVAFLFGFSRLAVIIGVYSNTPWSWIPYYAFATYLGQFFYEAPPGLSFHIKDLERLAWWKRLVTDWSVLWPLLRPMFVGSIILGTLLALIAYPLSLWLIRTYRSKAQPSLRGTKAEEIDR